jgi:hypothetical protein
MMSEVNVLWISPWRELQRNLASSLAHEGSVERRLAGESQGQGEAPPPTSWLFRARASEHTYRG